MGKGKLKKEKKNINTLKSPVYVQGSIINFYKIYITLNNNFHTN